MGPVIDDFMLVPPVQEDGWPDMSIVNIACDFGFCADSANAMSAAIAATMITTVMF